jgi:predicted nucleotidyltransferase
VLRDEILGKLRADKAALDRFGVKSIAVFGSVARGEGGAKSDVDILVEYREDATPGLFEFVGLKHHLEDVLGRKVDLATPDALHPALKDDILKETVYA